MIYIYRYIYIFIHKLDSSLPSCRSNHEVIVIDASRGSEVKQWSAAKIRHHDVWEAFLLARVWGQNMSKAYDFPHEWGDEHPYIPVILV